MIFCRAYFYLSVLYKRFIVLNFDVAQHTNEVIQKTSVFLTLIITDTYCNVKNCCIVTPIVTQARSDVKSAKRKAMLNSIFEMWDNEGSGYLDLDEVVFTMKKYKEGVDNAHIDKGGYL